MVYYYRLFDSVACGKPIANQADHAVAGTNSPEPGPPEHQGRSTASHTPNRFCEVHWHPRCTIPGLVDPMS